MSVCRGPFDDFATGFKRSRRGNLWCRWRGETLTVFRRQGTYRWSAADGERVVYSQGGWAGEDEALAGLWEAVCSWR
jgi:hypothetical protein